MKVKFADGLTIPGAIDPNMLKRKLISFIEDAGALGNDMKYDEGGAKFKVFYSINGDVVTINRIVSR